MRAQICGAAEFGWEAVERARALLSGQRLILVRDFTHSLRSNAVRVLTITAKPVGYIAHETARRVAPRMDRQEIWVATVLTPACVVYRSGRVQSVDNPVAKLWHASDQILEKHRILRCQAETPQQREWLQDDLDGLPTLYR